LIRQGVVSASWKPAKRRQKDIIDATWTKKHGKSHFGYKLSINVDKQYKIIHRIKTDTPARTTASTLTMPSMRATRVGTSMPTGATRPGNVKSG